MDKNKLIFKNSFFLAFRTFLSLLVSFYTTRVILHEMGTSDYGLFSVIYGVVGFFVFIVLAMNDSVQRFLSVKIGCNDMVELKNTFKNSLLIYAVFGFLLCFSLILVKDFTLHNVLSISPESLYTAQKIYIIACFSIFVLVIQTPFNALVLSFEKMSFYAYMSIYDACSKLLLAFCISQLTSEDKVVVYSFLLLLSSFVGFTIYVLFCFYNFRHVFRGGRIRFSIIRELYVFSFWNVFGGFASVSRIQGINILINVFFSTLVNASFAISNTVLNAVNLLTQSLVTAIRPQIFKSFAVSDYARYGTLITVGSKFTFVFLFVISLPVLVNTQELLAIWLTDVPMYAVGFVRTILSMALIDSLSFSIMAGIQATGKIKAYQLIVGFTVFINLPISYFIFKMGFSPIYICIPLILTSIINLNLRLFFLVRKKYFSYLSYYKEVFFPCFISLVFSLLVSHFAKIIIGNDSIIFILIHSVVSSILCLLIFWFFAVSFSEKQFCRNAYKNVRSFFIK